MTLGYRVKKQFDGGRCSKSHQYLIIFYTNKIKDNNIIIIMIIIIIIIIILIIIIIIITMQKTKKQKQKLTRV